MNNLPLFEPLFSGKPEPTGPPLSGRDLATSGIAQAYMNAPDDLELRYVFAIADLKVWTRITSEDLRTLCGDPPYQFRNCLAGVLAFARSIELLRFTGEKQTAKRKSIHAKEISIYQRTDTNLDREWIETEFKRRKERARRRS